MPPSPSRTFPLTHALRDSLLRVRQAPATTVTVTSSSGGSSNDLSGGAIAGIVIGSVVGFLLLLWILRSCMNLGAPPQDREEAWYDDVHPDRRRHRHRGDRYVVEEPVNWHRSRHRSTSRRPETYMPAEPVPVVVRSTSRRRASTSRPARSPRRSGGYVVEEQTRGRSGPRYDSY